MKIYIKNTNDNSIQIFTSESYESISKNFRQPPYEKATQQEADSFILQEAKESKITEIKANKDSFIYLPVDYNGSTFKNTEISGKNLETAYNFIDEPIQWLDIQDNTIALTKLQVKDLITLMISHRSTGYFLEASLINQVKACLTTAEVNNIDITFI